MPDRKQLEAMLERTPDNPLLCFALGTALMKEGQAAGAAVYLARALTLDPGYSAAWKFYGQSLVDAGRNEEAIRAYRQGIESATQKGDLQAVREMRVFLRRLEKSDT